MIYDFYTNFLVSENFSGFSSRVFFVDIEFTKEELCHFLQVTMEGGNAHNFVSSHRPGRWTPVNRVLRNSNLHTHSPNVDELLRDPRVVQHVLRHTILTKAGDRPKITPILSIVTFFVMTGKPFDVPDLLIRYMASIAEIREPHCSKHHNVALGHIIAHLIKQKYDLDCPEAPDVLPIFFSNRSFYNFYKDDTSRGKKKKRAATSEEEEEEEEIHLHDTHGTETGASSSIEERLSRLETKFDMEQRENQLYRAESREHMAWMRNRFARDD